MSARIRIVDVSLRRRDVLAGLGAVAVAAVIEAASSPLRTMPNDFKRTMTTLFWVGEPSDASNAFIPNNQSYWDKDWQESFGGIDDPHHRDGHWPAKFKPRENPFYFALPYGEFTEEDQLKADARRVPWYVPDLSPLLKNRWIEIRRAGRTCFAQWQDVGPCNENDFGYVFGKREFPKNTFEAKAGLDVSPAVWHYLGMKDNGTTSWRFVDATEVDPGPWTEIVTTSGNNR